MTMDASQLFAYNFNSQLRESSSFAEFRDAYQSQVRMLSRKLNTEEPREGEERGIPSFFFLVSGR